MADDLNPLPDQPTPASAPKPAGRYGLNHSMLHPFALTHPANALATRPDALAHATAMTGGDDQKLSEPDQVQEVQKMPFADLLREVGARFVSEVSEMVVQEAGRASQQIAEVFDLRMRSGETFMRDVPGVDRVTEPPMGPSPPTTPTPAFDQVVAQAAAVPATPAPEITQER